MTVVTSARIVQKNSLGFECPTGSRIEAPVCWEGNLLDPTVGGDSAPPASPKKDFWSRKKRIFFVDKALIKKFFKTILGCI